MTEVSLSWLLTGKLSVLLSLSGLMIILGRRIGSRVTLWCASALLVSLSVGVSILPSILGALMIALLTSLSLMWALTRSSQPDAWRQALWPTAVSFAFILSVGRVGCWLAGCCFGEVTEAWWATHYAADSMVAHYHLDRYGPLMDGRPLSVHPVQLYESALVALSLALGALARRRWGEVSAALLWGAAYLIIRASLDPLRACVNTLSSLEFTLGLSHFQWACLSLATLALIGAMRARGWATPSQLSPYVGQQLKHMEPAPSLKWLALAWLGATCVGLLSARLGTPFTAQLSAIGVCLASVPLLIHLRVMTRGWLSRWEALPRPIIGPLSQVSFALALTLTALPPLLPLSLEGEAKEGALGSSSTGRAWRYGMDPITQKLGRFGRADEELPKVVVDGEEPPAAEPARVDPRWRIAFSAGGASMTESDVGCGGEQEYVQTNDWIFSQLTGSYRYMEDFFGFRVSFVGYAGMGQMQSGEQPKNDSSLPSIDLGTGRALMVGSGVMLERSWLKLGLAVGYQHLKENNSGNSMSSDFGTIAFDKYNIPIRVDYLLGLGYTGDDWSAFLEAGSGPNWGGYPTQDQRLYLSYSGLSSQFTFKYSLLAISHVTSLIITPGIDVAKRFGDWELRGSFLLSSGLREGQAFGLGVGRSF